MQKFFSNLLIVFLIILGLVYLFSTLNALSVTTTQVSLNELIQKIESQEIKKIIVQPNLVIGTIDDKNQVTAKKEMEKKKNARKTILLIPLLFIDPSSFRCIGFYPDIASVMLVFLPYCM